MSNSIAVSTPTVSMVNGVPQTTSLALADFFKKQHGHVLRSIQTLDCSKEFTESNFGLSDYLDSTGRKLPMYNLTKDGFMFLVMGFTGKEAARLKEAYIKRFNEMEATLKPVGPVISPEQHIIELQSKYIALLEQKAHAAAQPVDAKKPVQQNGKRLIKKELNFNPQSIIEWLAHSIHCREFHGSGLKGWHEKMSGADLFNSYQFYCAHSNVVLRLCVNRYNFSRFLKTLFHKQQVTAARICGFHLGTVDQCKTALNASHQSAQIFSFAAMPKNRFGGVQ
jgi:Rha family phage regulatory protein